MSYRPQEVAQRLGISPSTLRLWSTQFADALSQQARKMAEGGAGVMAQRRYTEQDVTILTRIKERLAQGLTYEETRHQLRQLPQPPAGDGRDAEGPVPVPAATQQVNLQLESLREALEAKEKTIAALKESLAFMDIYLRTVLQEREDARSRERLLQQELDELRTYADRVDGEIGRPWWKRLLAIP